MSAICRIALNGLVVLTVLYAGAHLFFTLLDEAPFTWKLAKICIAAGVVVYGLLLLMQLSRPSALAKALRWVTYFGALAMIAVGAANVVWTAHLGIMSGDWEYYGILGGGLIALQGALVATWLAWRNTVGQPQLNP